MEKSVINDKQLNNYVVRYEESTLNRTFLKKCNNNDNYMLFKSGKKNRLVIVSKSIWIEKNIDKILDAAQGIIDSEGIISDTIELFTTAVVDKETEGILKNKALLKYDLNLVIIDSNSMRKDDIFSPVFENVKEEGLSVIEKALYDFLSTSEVSSEIKKSLLYSLILIAIFEEKDGITLSELRKKIEKVVGKDVENLEAAISVLRTLDYIMPAKHGESRIQLSPYQKDIIDDAIKKTKKSEDEFYFQFKCITDRYSILQPDVLLRNLRDLINVFYDGFGKDDESVVNVKNADWTAKISSFVVPEKQESFIKDIEKLLKDNSFLNREYVGEKFLDLYRSDKYEQYVNGKTNFIVLDTMVFIHLLCCVSMYHEEYDEWDDVNYKNVLGLLMFIDDSKSNLKVLIPVDYINETIGELKKAIQLTWLSNLDLSIPFKSSNTFFNYYLYIRQCASELGDAPLTFSDFLEKAYGFTNCDIESRTFKNDSIKVIKKIIQLYGMESIFISTQYQGFDNVKMAYKDYLKDKNKSKYDNSLNSDIRVSYYIASNYSSEFSKERGDYYLVTADTTLKQCRKLVNTELNLGRSYEIKNSGDLVQTLAVKTFNINKSAINNNVFACADQSFGFTDKVTSLFDNVLNPYFASCSKKNPQLVKALVKLESEQEEKIDNIINNNDSDKTKLENIFSSIVQRLASNDCSQTDFRDFLSDEQNTEYVIEFFKKAYIATEKKLLDETYVFIDNLKDYIIKREKQDNSLGEDED